MPGRKLNMSTYKDNIVKRFGNVITEIKKEAEDSVNLKINKRTFRKDRRNSDE